MAENLFKDLVASLPDGTVQTVLVGTHWTAVVIETEGQRRCGLAASLSATEDHHHGAGPAVPDAGRLHQKSAQALTRLIYSNSPPEVSVGMATINALLPPREQEWIDLNAEFVIAEHGKDNHVVLVGHFPFIPRLRQQVGRLSVLELDPRGDDLPAEAAPDVVPEASVVALTSTTLLNGTFEGLIQLCRPESLVLLLGPTTPMSPIFFEYGVDILSGARVKDIDSVLFTVGQGGNFRQVHRAGVRLVTMQAPHSGGQ